MTQRMRFPLWHVNFLLFQHLRRPRCLTAILHPTPQGLLPLVLPVHLAQTGEGLWFSLWMVFPSLLFYLGMITICFLITLPLSFRLIDKTSWDFRWFSIAPLTMCKLVCIAYFCRGDLNSARLHLFDWLWQMLSFMLPKRSSPRPSSVHQFGFAMSQIGPHYYEILDFLLFVGITTILVGFGATTSWLMRPMLDHCIFPMGITSRFSLVLLMIMMLVSQTWTLERVRTQMMLLWETQRMSILVYFKARFSGLLMHVQLFDSVSSQLPGRQLRTMSVHPGYHWDQIFLRDKILVRDLGGIFTQGIFLVLNDSLTRTPWLSVKRRVELPTLKHGIFTTSTGAAAEKPARFACLLTLALGRRISLIFGVIPSMLTLPSSFTLCDLLHLVLGQNVSLHMSFWNSRRDQIM